MTDIEIPDNEDAACALDDCIASMARKGSYHWAEACRSAARRLRADAEEIARLEAKVAALEMEVSREKALANHQSKTLEAYIGTDRRDPLTRIAAALERPSKEWVAALTLVGAARDCPTYESTVTSAFKFADALLAEMGEG